jgi:hypothetical protein
MITISDISNRLQAQLPEIVLSPALFDNDANLKSLLQQYFSRQTGSIAISGVQAANYKFDSAAGTITFSGTGKGGPFDRFTIAQVVIKFVSNVPQISISATGPDGWLLSTGFPDLKSPVLKQLPVKSPHLYWSSYESDKDEIIKGFYLEGNLDMDIAPLSMIKFLLPGLKNPPLWGKIEMQGTTTDKVMQYVPDMILSMDASDQSVTAGGFKLEGPELAIFANPVFNTTDHNWQTESFVRLSSQMQFNNEWILLQADIKNTDSNIILSAQMDVPIGGGLSELAKLAGADLSVPGFEIKAQNDINLKNISLGLNPGGNGLINLISVEIATSKTEEWKLWENTTLKNIDIVFQVIPGTQGAKTQVSASVQGTVNDWLLLKGAFSQGYYTFYAGLARPVTIAEAYKFFSGTDTAGLPELEIDELDVSFTVPPGATESFAWSGGISVDGNWELFKKPFVMALEGLLFKASRSTDGKSAFTAGAILNIDDYSMSIEGDYTTDSGWTLSGNLALHEEGQNLSQISSRISNQFQLKDTSTSSLPHFLTAWQVKNLAAQYSTKSNDFDFTADIKNSDIPALDLGFGIHLAHTETSITKTFDATAKYKGTNVDVKFDIEIKIQNNTGSVPARIVTFTGTYKAVKPPKLSDLLQAVSQDLKMNVELPQELGLDAEAKDFALLVQQTDSNPVQLELAGDMGLQIAGSNLDIYAAYTNKVAYDSEFKQPANNGDNPAYVIGAAFGGIINLAGLPFVGKLPGINKLAIDKLGFFYTNAPVASGQKLYFEVPQLEGAGKLAPNPTQTTLTNTGFNFTAAFGTLNNTTPPTVNPFGSMPLALPTNPAQKTPPPFAVAPAKPLSPISWIDINKTFGPFTLKQIGLNYSKGEATIGMSAGLALSSFNLEVQGLSVSFPMPLPGQQAAGKVSFNLQGLGLDIKEPGFELGGFFLKDETGGITSFYGQVIVKVGTFGLQAIGGYSPGVDPPAFFIYLKMDVPLGGPPFLFVTGLAGGFGINSKLNLPTIEGMPTCILLPHNAPDQAGSASDAIKNILPQLKSIFGKPQPGEYWIAAGVQFTSFEMINAFALVTVSFGVDLQIGLLGTASMTFPTGVDKPVAYVEIDILATYTQSAGLLAIDGRVSPASYIYGGFVKLAGGFSFYTWLSGPNKGEFVVSLGGYHPAFKKPDFYPAVPRLSIAFGLGPFQVSGQAYFALTPGMLMAGMHMQAIWDAGPLKAWLGAGIDFLIAWAPFHYEAGAYIVIGVSLDLGLFTIKIHVGAELKVWGPPFGGVANVDLDIVTFSIHFGAAQELPAPIGWNTFKSSFLPQETKKDGAKVNSFAAQDLRAMDAGTDSVSNIIKASVNEGLLQKNVGGYDWVLDADKFSIVTSSTIPANFARFNPDDKKVRDANISGDSNLYDLDKVNAPYLVLNGEKIFDKDKKLVWNPDLHIGPMNKKNVSSYHFIKILKRNAAGEFKEPVNTFMLQPVLLDSSAALWAENKPEKTANDPSHVLSALTGFIIKPIPRQPDLVKDILLEELLFEINPEVNFSCQKPAGNGFVVTAQTDSQKNQIINVSGLATEQITSSGYVLNGLNHPWVHTQRNAILDDLMNNGFATYTSDQVTLSDFTSAIKLTHWPLVTLPGSDYSESETLIHN